MTEDFDIREERFSQGEKDFENALRPLSFSDFSGQKKVVENLEVFVEAAKYRGEPLDHTLLHGPPGLGKTTLSNIIANELGVGFKITSGPRQARRSGRHTDLAREERCAVYRRDPPLVACGRRVSIQCDGGLPH